MNFYVGNNYIYVERERVIEKVKIITGEERLEVVIILSRIVKAINYWNVFNVKK